MIIGERLRVLREEKKLSQGDIEKRTGLLRCYLSRVENGHTVPSLDTLSKIAGAMELPHLSSFPGRGPPDITRRRAAQEVNAAESGAHFYE